MASGLRASHGYTFAGSGHLTRHTCYLLGGSSKSQALSDAPIPTGIPLPALYTWHRHLHREGSSLTGRWLSVRRRFRGFNHIKHTANGESYNAGWRYVGFIHGEGVWSFRLFGNVISSAVLGFGGIFRRTNHHSLYLSSTWNPFSLVKCSRL